MAVVLPNGVELVAILFALASLGAATVPLNPAYTEPEFRFYLDDLVPQLLLIGESAAPNARAAAGSIPIAEVVAAAPGQPVDLRAGGRALGRGRLERGRRRPSRSRCCCTPAAPPPAPSRCRCCSAT